MRLAAWDSSALASLPSVQRTDEPAAHMWHQISSGALPWERRWRLWAGILTLKVEKFEAGRFAIMVISPQLKQQVRILVEDTHLPSNGEFEQAERRCSD
jgi:hypothetical protein